MRVAYFIEGTFIPERDGASTRFARLPAAICRSGVGVFVFHAFRGWSSLDRIACEPYPTYFFQPHNYHNNLDLLVSLVNRESIDIVQMNDLETVYNVGLPLAHATGIRLVYESLYHSSTLAKQLGLSAKRLNSIHFLEHEVADSVDHIITLSEPDRKRWIDISKAPSDRLSIVPFGIDITRGINVPDWVGRPSVVFLGNCYFEPNRRAVERIAADIWPALRCWNTEASCLIIGDMPPELRAACLKAGIQLAGEVPDPRPFLSKCAIGIAPVTEGSGVRVKLLHYLASGLPAIATSTAAEGLEFPAIVIEDRLSSYVEAIRSLVADSRRVGRQILESQILLNRSFSWEKIAEMAAETYREVMRRPIRERPGLHPRFEGVPMWLDEAIQSGRFAGCDDLSSISYTYGIAHRGVVNMY